MTAGCMLWAIRRDQRGVSNIIVVVLGLVIIVIITSNVILWSYEMNQLDWEKMKENIAIIGVTRVGDVWSYNASRYTLGGSTSWVSGSVSNLTSDDGVYMTFRSYYSGTDTSNFVDNNTSDVDSFADKGTHSNFTAQQNADSSYDTLTEQGFLSTDSGPKYAVIGSTSEIIGAPDQNYATIVKAGTCEVTDYQGGTGTIIQVYFNITYYGAVSGTLAWAYQLDGGGWNNIEDLPEGGSALSPLTRTYNATNLRGSWTWGNLNTTDIQFQNNDAGSPENAYVDAMYVTVVTETTNYELDSEVQWTSVDYDETNEELCIYAGDMGTEDLRVDYWTGSTWSNLLVDLTANNWNNVSVSLTSTTFTIRFKGGSETGDASQDSWGIDVTLLHVWSDEYPSEVEFTGSSNMENWSQLNWTVNSAWTIGSVSVTLQLYNHTLDGYPASGNGYMAYTSDSTPNTDETESQTINVNPTNFRNATGYWKMKVKGVKTTDTQFGSNVDWIEFKVAKTTGTIFTFENGGSLTCHLVSLWVINSTVHEHYDVNVFVNSGETLSYPRMDISLPNGQYVVKVVTARGNIAVYSGS
ncbi:MAG: hypothetical protein NWE87_02625 [Candidatus Bathyarchaeota archaeon]|nr:hypothetical protein [Candidatus Bathyarchaeota archaeon]